MKWFMLETATGFDENVYSEVAKARKEEELIEKDKNEIVQRLAVLKKLKNISEYERSNLLYYYPIFYDELSSLFSEPREFIKEDSLIEEMISDYEDKLMHLKETDVNKTWKWKEVKLLRK